MDHIEEQLGGGPTGAEVQAKFAKFWPRKVLILFGPP